MAGRRLAQPRHDGQVAHAQLSAQQCDQKPQPARISEQPEHVGKINDVGLGRHRGLGACGLARVDGLHGTGVERPDI